MAIGSRGHILASVVVMTAVLLVAGVATIQLTRTQLRANAGQLSHERAFYVAEAGIQRGIAQLDQDRATARSSLSYTYSASESFGPGTYTVTISQDSAYPTDATRKRIDSVGQVTGVQSSTVAHVVVQDQDPCAICYSDAGTCRILTNVAATTNLFNGLVHSNQDVLFNVTAGVAPNAQGTIRAGRDLISNSAVSLLATLGASAFRARNYVSQGLHSDLLGNPLLGIHFANGTGKHGAVAALTPRVHPAPDYDRIRRDPNTVLVNADNPPPFGSWDAASKTWVHNGTIAFPTSPSVTYYVDGNARLTSVVLAKSTAATIVTRGWLAFSGLDLVTGSLGIGVDVAAVAGSPTSVLTVGSGSSQNLTLVAEKQLTIGLPVLSLSPVTWGTETAAMVGGLTGIGLSVASVGSTSTKIFGYSETSTVWGKISTVNALSTAQLSFMGKGDTTIAYTASVGSNVTCPY